MTRNSILGDCGVLAGECLQAVKKKFLLQVHFLSVGCADVSDENNHPDLAALTKLDEAGVENLNGHPSASLSSHGANADAGLARPYVATDIFGESIVRKIFDVNLQSESVTELDAEKSGEKNIL